VIAVNPKATQTFADGVQTAHSVAYDARQAVQEIHAAFAAPDLKLVIFFCSREYDREALSEEMNRAFSGIPVVGCTTAGEFGAAGYRDHSLSAVSLAGEHFSVAVARIDGLAGFETSHGREVAADLRRRLQQAGSAATHEDTFGLLLIDGLSTREESVAGSLQNGLERIPLVGGSAGDGQAFQATYVFADGTFHSDRAALALISTALPFTVMKTQHFVATDTRAVVTASDEHRVVREIDAWPAAEGYARLLGLDVGALDPSIFAKSPLVVVINGTNYVRSIQKANRDGSLTLYCAIEEGVVMRMVRGVDLFENLENAFAEIRVEIGQPRLFIGFDCLLRRLDCARLGLIPQVNELFRSNNVVGFNTYGEQFRGVHVNQTFTGVAIGSARAADDDG